MQKIEVDSISPAWVGPRTRLSLTGRLDRLVGAWVRQFHAYATYAPSCLRLSVFHASPPSYRLQTNHRVAAHICHTGSRIESVCSRRLWNCGTPWHQKLHSSQFCHVLHRPFLRTVGHLVGLPPCQWQNTTKQPRKKRLRICF